MADREQQRMSHLDRPAAGADLPMRERPGVPMETQPRPLSSAVRGRPPEQQTPVRGVTHRRELAGPTKVFSSAGRPRLLSGVVRRLAYRVSETKARHWLALMLADRIDVLERRLGGLLKMGAAAGALLLGARLLRRA